MPGIHRSGLGPQDIDETAGFKDEVASPSRPLGTGSENPIGLRRRRIKTIK